MRWLDILVVVMTSLVLAACSQTVQQSGLPGTYVLRSSSSVALLELNPDGSFKQTLVRNGSELNNVGIWKWDDRTAMLVLTDALNVKNGGVSREWITVLPVVKTFRRQRLIVDNASGDAYEKQ
jgi:hypothetical protein